MKNLYFKAVIENMRTMCYTFMDKIINWVVVKMSNQRENVFIINPVAGKGESLLVEARIKEALNGTDLLYHIYQTTAPRDGERYVRTYAKENQRKEILFIACGGDGTLNEVVNGAAGFEKVYVTHYPCGSGNDFIKSLGVESSYYKDILSLLAGDAREINLIECSGRYALNICSVGLDARIAADVTSVRKIPWVSGSGAYMVSMMINLFKKINQKYDLIINGENLDGTYVIVVAANGSYYGGSFNPVPEADPSDGVLDFLLIRKLSRFVVARAVGAYKKGRYRDLMKYFTKLEGSTLFLKSKNTLPVNIDGEIMKTDTVDIKMSSQKLQFLIPQP